jgi:hypothetical protein
MKRKQLPGFDYDPKRKRAVLDGFVPGTKCKVRRQRTLDNVTRDQALAAWKVFRAELASGRAIEGPLTLRRFVEGYYGLIAASHAAGTRKTQGMIIKNHLLRYFGDDELVAISTIRVIDFMADLRVRSCSASLSASHLVSSEYHQLLSMTRAARVAQPRSRFAEPRPRTDARQINPQRFHLKSCIGKAKNLLPRP